ncbi:hypothetical protein ACFFRR_003810 [Megaselia abdita]
MCILVCLFPNWCRRKSPSMSQAVFESTLPLSLSSSTKTIFSEMSLVVLASGVFLLAAGLDPNCLDDEVLLAPSSGTSCCKKNFQMINKTPTKSKYSNVRMYFFLMLQIE